MEANPDLTLQASLSRTVKGKEMVWRNWTVEFREKPCFLFVCLHPTLQKFMDSLCIKHTEPKATPPG